MFYTITVTKLQGKPVFKYAFADKDDAEKYFQRIIEEKIHTQANLIFQDSKNDIIGAVYIQATQAHECSADYISSNT